MLAWLGEDRRLRACTRSNEPDGSPVRLASVVTISPPVGPRPAANSAAIAVLRRVSIQAGNPPAR
jgi:hypothetical protein